MPDGREISSYTLTNSSGASVKLLELGARMAELHMPDKNGRLADIICGFDSAAAYMNDTGYQGSIIGRYGNRIENAEFTLNGVTYKLYKNSFGQDSLHGGREGFNAKLWDAHTETKQDRAEVAFSYLSPDGKEGYPGTLNVTVTYIFTEQNELIIHYVAQTDKDTVINLTNHAYYNLSGYDGGSVMEHLLWLDCGKYNAVNERLIPEGDPADTEGTIFDFRKEKKIENPLDHNFIFNSYDGKLHLRGTLCDPESGRELKMYTDMPGVQIYTAGGMNGDTPFKGGVKQRPLHAVCLETQFSPNSPNRPDFPSCVLPAGEVYDHTTVYSFGIRK